MIFKLLIIFFSVIFTATTFAQDIDLGCLEHEWQQISPSEAEKKFDMANDFDKSGRRAIALLPVSHPDTNPTGRAGKLLEMPLEYGAR